MKPEPTQNELFHAELIKAKEETILALRECINEVNRVAAALILRAEQIKPEVGEGFKGRLQRIVYRETPLSGEGSIKEKTSESTDEVKPMGKRFCSICRKPGHRATTCPSKGNHESIS